MLLNDKKDHKPEALLSKKRVRRRRQYSTPDRGKTMKNDRWVYYKDVKPQDMGGGVTRRVLAYSDDLIICGERGF